MRADARFYVQLYAHTGGKALSSFEVKLVHDASVCVPVPASGAPSLARAVPVTTFGGSSVSSRV